MQRKLTTALALGALALGSGAALAQPRAFDDYSFRAGRAADWNLAAADGQCRLRIWVDDKALVQMRGDQIVVRTESGRRSYDQGSVCTQPLPLSRVDDFRVTLERGRGALYDVLPPSRRNNFAGALSIDDPQAGGETYELVVAWRDPDRPGVPLAANDPLPHFDDTRACQDRVRADFLARNRDGDAYVEFTTVPAIDDAGPHRERIRGEGWARNRFESRALAYQCVVNQHTNRVVTSSYDMAERGRFSQLR